MKKDSSRKLKHPPVQEVVFEIRFKEMEDYGLLLARLTGKLDKSYPNAQSLVPQQLPFGFGANVYRHRFTSKNGKELYQIGENIISINTLNYEIFEDFLETVQTVLKVFLEVSSQKIITRMGLRYVNKIENLKNVDEVLQYELVIPKSISLKTEATVNRLIFDVKDLGKMGVVIEKNHASSALLLDLDLFNSVEKQPSLSQISKWLKGAHQEIGKAFVSSFREEYFQKLKGN